MNSGRIRKDIPQGLKPGFYFVAFTAAFDKLRAG